MLICIVAFTIPISGQTLLKAWDFDGFNGDEGPTLATFNATGIGATTGDVRRAAGIIAFPAGGFDNVYISRDFDNTTLVGARSASEYVKISIRPEAGFGLQLTELTIQIGRQGNGPNEFALFTDAGGDNFVTLIGSHTSTINGTGNYETVTFDLTTTGLFDNCTTSSNAVSFRLYGYGNSVDPSADFNRFWFGNGLADATNDIEISGYVEAIPDAPTHPSETVEFCEGAGNPDRLLRLINPSPIDGSGDQVVVWVVQSAPAAAGLTVGQEFMPPCSAPGSYTDANFFLSGTNDNSIRLQPTAPVGDYVFSAKVLNCNTGCESELSKETYTISKKADPMVSITADPTGDVCLNTLGVQYDPNLTATDGGTYAYAWCAYNNGLGSGTCFDGFDDNTAAMPTRDWVTSTGARSVGVTVSSTTPGCEASDLYSFTVNPNPAAPTEPAKTIAFCEGAPGSDRLLRLINPSPISGDQVVVWVLQSAPAGVALAEYNPPCSVPGSFTSPDGFFFLSGTNDNSIRLEPAAPVGDYVFKAKVLDCATGCTSDLSAATYTISKFANPSDAFRPAGTDVSFPFTGTLDFDADHDACPGDVFEYGTQANTAGINTISWALS
ncbi:MAG: hypothetical protein RIC19_17985, partial [Phaeodactylibacter sp.]|uniref:hypothetical protein n=1 Tax=Phaeodactylibacter sp. TaxID=1940289 RepID=UPI0032EC2A9C